MNQLLNLLRTVLGAILTRLNSLYESVTLYQDPLKETRTFHDRYFGYRTRHKTNEPESVHALLLSCLNVSRYVHHGQAVCCLISRRSAQERKMFLFTTEYVFGVRDNRDEEGPVIEWSRPLLNIGKHADDENAFVSNVHPDKHNLRTVKFPTRDIPDTYNPRLLRESSLKHDIIACCDKALHHRIKLLEKQGLA